LEHPSTSHSLLCCSGSLDGGGSERQLWQLASQIDRGRFQPQIYLLYRRGVYLSQVPSDVPVHAFDDLPQSQRGIWPGRMHALQVEHLTRQIKQSSIEVVYDRTFHMTLVTASACRRAGCPRVSVIVSPPSRDLVASRERFRWFKRRLLRRAYTDPLAIPLAVSQAVAEDAESYYRLRPGRISVLPSPVDIPRIEADAAGPLPPTAITGQPDSHPRLRLAIVARLTQEKGHADLIEALALLTRQRPEACLRLDVIGDGPLRNELERLAKNNGLHASIHFQGFQSNPYPWMRAADVVCVPSLYEGLPNVALESMALGVPLLMTDSSSSVRHLIGDNDRGCLVPVRQPTALAMQLADALDHPQRWLERGRRGQSWVAQHHSLPGWLDQMSAILQTAIEGYPAARRPR
jgi:glycosyltransferase involved in cell wall biosynthesis